MGGGAAPFGSTGGRQSQALDTAVPAGAPRMGLATDPQRQPVARLVASNPEPAAQPAALPQAAASAAKSALKITSLGDIAAIAAEKRDIQLKLAVERQMRPVKFEPGRIEVALLPTASRDLVQDLGRKLADWTGERWIVIVSREEGGPTIAEEREAAHDQLMSDARADPLVAAVMRKFPGAQIVDVRVQHSEEAEAARVAAAVPQGTGEDAGVDDDVPMFAVDDPGWDPDL